MLRLLGRPHDAATARAAYFAARQAGFANIGLDFLWGLPGQRLSQWLVTLKEAVRLSPEHLSCYGLTLEPGTPFAAMADSGEIAPPAEAVQAEMFVRGAQYLESHGYLHYEISNFAAWGSQPPQPGYWEGPDYWAWGRRRVPRWPDGGHENPRDVAGSRHCEKREFRRGGKDMTPQEVVRELVCCRCVPTGGSTFRLPRPLRTGFPQGLRRTREGVAAKRADPPERRASAADQERPDGEQRDPGQAGLLTGGRKVRGRCRPGSRPWAGAGAGVHGRGEKIGRTVRRADVRPGPGCFSTTVFFRPVLRHHGQIGLHLALKAAILAAGMGSAVIFGFARMLLAWPFFTPEVQVRAVGVSVRTPVARLAWRTICRGDGLGEAAQVV
jgi:hypothetical protein